jgi:hypothetical protein
MHVVTTRRHYRAKDGTERVSEAHLLRRSYRQAGKVKTRTLANLSPLPAVAIEAVRAGAARPRSRNVGLMARL